MLNICHALLNPQAPSFVYIFPLSHENTHFATHFEWHQAIKQFKSRGGRGVIGGFNVYFKIRTSAELSPCWCKWKMCVVPGYAWLSREQSSSQSRGICCVWGLPFRLPAWRVGGFMGPSPSVLLSQVPHLQHAREMNWGHRRGSIHFFRTSEIHRETMRLQRSLGLVAALGVITCICAFYTTAALDIPLEGEY